MKRALLILVLICSQLSLAQEFETHIWQNRLVVMLVDTPENKTFKKQYQELVQSEKGLKERKLLLYLVTSSDHPCTLDRVKCLSNAATFSKLKKYETNFELILIGLDGGKKIHRKSPLTSQQLFDIIDAMPMRAQELRKN